MYSEETYETFTLANPIADARLRRLTDRLDACTASEEYLKVIAKIVRTRDPQSVEGWPPSSTARARWAVRPSTGS